MIQQPILGYVAKGNENRISTRHLHALLTMAKICNQLKRPSMGEWLEDVAHSMVRTLCRSQHGWALRRATEKDSTIHPHTRHPNRPKP